MSDGDTNTELTIVMNNVISARTMNRAILRTIFELADIVMPDLPTTLDDKAKPIVPVTFTFSSAAAKQRFAAIAAGYDYTALVVGAPGTAAALAELLSVSRRGVKALGIVTM